MNFINGSLLFHCSSLEEVWVTVLNITGPLSSWSVADNKLPGDLILSNYGFVILNLTRTFPYGNSLSGDLQLQNLQMEAHLHTSVDLVVVGTRIGPSG